MGPADSVAVYSLKVITLCSPLGDRDDVVTKFRAAREWLDGDLPHPPFLHLVFAAREELSGDLFVRCLTPGDWWGIPANNPLPPTKRDHPPGW